MSCTYEGAEEKRRSLEDIMIYYLRGRYIRVYKQAWNEYQEVERYTVHS